VKIFQIRPLNEGDKGWVASLLKEHWAGPKVVTRGRVHYADKLPGFVAVKDNERVGLTTYNIVGNQCEVMTMNSLAEKTGIGAALIDAAKKVAVSEGCRRLWLITTNDNTDALRFYQKRGFHLKAIYSNAIKKSRQLKPEIPSIGNEDIPIRDEIELEMIL
jgi:GNAT superfamily N-acetyltransferase